MKNMLNIFLDLIYKKKCYFCKQSSENSIMCSKCYDLMDFNTPQAKTIYNGVNIFCAGIYEKTMQKLIRGIKYHKKKDLAFFQAKFMYNYFQSLSITKNYQIVPVPLYKNRQKERGYNHMELVAEEFCKMSGFPLNTSLIKRVKNTKPQYRLKKQERRNNLKNAFSVDTKDLNTNFDILIIDDIFTTGSTFESMIDELNKNNIHNITCLAAASAN